MLELHHPLWSELDTAFGKGDEVPELIESLLHDYHEETFQELTELLLHQYTIYEATVATVPYFIQMAEKSPLPVRTELYITCGMIQAAYASSAANMGKTIAGEQWTALQRAYTDALKRIDALHESVLEYARIKIDNRYEQDYMIAAWLAYGHHHALAQLLIHYAGGEEYEGICPACEQYFYVVVSDDGAITLSPDDPVFIQNAKHTEVIPAQMPSAGAWGALRSAAEQIEAKSLLGRLPYMTGTGICPHCQETISVADALC